VEAETLYAMARRQVANDKALEVLAATAKVGETTDS
jgi:hypothetical protein